MKKIMIFGRPGSGKSSFAFELSKLLNINPYHLDRIYFQENWKVRRHEDFLTDQKAMLRQKSWIIDGNSLKTLELRFSQADCIVYFNFPKIICLYRLIKRYFCPHIHLKDRAENCPEVLRFKFLVYMWTYEEKVNPILADLKKRFPDKKYFEVNNQRALLDFKKSLLNRVD